MSRRNPHIVTVRVSEDTLRKILRFAHSSGLYTVDEKPNVSAAVNVLLGIAFDDHTGQEVAGSAYQAARANLLNDVRLKLDVVLQDLAAELA